MEKMIEIDKKGFEFYEYEIEFIFNTNWDGLIIAEKDEFEFNFTKIRKLEKIGGVLIHNEKAIENEIEKIKDGIREGLSIEYYGEKNDNLVLKRYGFIGTEINGVLYISNDYSC